VLVFGFDFDTQGWASHTPSMRQNILDWNCFLELFQAVTDLAMRTLRTRTEGFAVCLRNRGSAASLDVRKLYPVVSDTDAAANDLIRVIDESGEDYLCPARLFRKLVLPIELQRALRVAS